MSKRTNPVMVRLDDAQLRELDAIAARVEVPASTLAHNAVTALLRAYRRDNYVTLPLEFRPRDITYLPPEPDDVSVNESKDPTPGPAAQAAAKATIRQLRKRGRAAEESPHSRPPHK